VNYFIQREGQQYGPYTLADLQRYTASGEILVTDMATSEASSEAVPVSQIIGTIAVPAPATRIAADQPAADFPRPPNLHWGLVLLFGTLTCGLFSIVWDIVQASWMRKLEPASRALYIYIGAAVLLVLIYAASVGAAFTHTPAAPMASLFQLAYAVILIWGRFSLRSSMEEHFNGPDPMGLSLSGVMTFFFGGIYFQYHINDIVRRKHQDALYRMSQ